MLDLFFPPKPWQLQKREPSLVHRMEDEREQAEMLRLARKRVTEARYRERKRERQEHESR